MYSKKIKYVNYIIYFIVISELFINAYISLSSYSYKELKEYKNILNYNNLITSIKDNSFFQINQKLKKFFKETFKITGSGIYTSTYNNNNEFIDSLLAIKYYISKNKLNYEVADKEKEYYLYQNNNYFPLIYASNKQIININFTDDIIENYNRLYQVLSNSKEKIFVGKQNVIEFNNCHNDEKECIVRLKKDYVTNNYSYVLFTNQNFEVTNTLTKERYGASENSGVLLLRINDEDLLNINLLNFDESDIKYYEIDSNLLESLSKEKQINQLKITHFKDTHIIGNYYNENEDNIIVSSIPYTKGWKVIVNGKEPKIYKIMGNFIGFDIEKGNNEIEIIFVTPGLYWGINISSISLFSLILYNKCKKARRKYV